MIIKRTILALFLVAVVFSSCMNKYDKSKHEFTTKIQDGYYLETYNVFSQGAFGTDIYADYLTDSTTFRLFIDTYDTENEAISYSIKGDTIILTKYHFKKNKEKDIVFKKIFPVKELKTIKQFD